MNDEPDSPPEGETPPPDLVRGCDSPEGVHVLADWLDEHGGDGAEFREQPRDSAELPPEHWGMGFGNSWGDGERDAFGYCEWDDRESGTGCGYGIGLGFLFRYGNEDGNGIGDGYGDEEGDGIGNGLGYGFGHTDGDGSVPV